MLDDNQEPISEFWRLADHVNIVQAALLLVGIEPGPVMEYVENWDAHNQPHGYLAARDAIASAVESGSLEGTIARQYEDSPWQGGTVEVETTDYYASTINVKSIIAWLDERGFATDAFGKPDRTKAGFRDPTHPRYSPKLVAAVDAWEHFDEESKEVGTPKQKLMKWLRLNASQYGLTDDQGVPSENVIEELAKAANWATSGGAPKTQKDEPAPD